MDRDAEDDQANAGDVRQGRDLAKHDQADDRRCGGEQREHEGEGGARQARHGQLVSDVGITEEQRPTPTPHRSHAGWVKAGAAGTIPNGVATTAAMSMDMPSWSILLIGDAGEPLPSAAVFAMRWPSITYSMKPRQLANANAKPSG